MDQGGEYSLVQTGGASWIHKSKYTIHIFSTTVLGIIF
jgi:hypothetical protein